MRFYKTNFKLDNSKKLLLFGSSFFVLLIDCQFQINLVLYIILLFFLKKTNSLH